jgi:molecular chaperone DnaJ
VADPPATFTSNSRLAPHEVFRREGDDLEVVVKIPMTAAALGTQVMVATLEADLEDSAEETRAVRVTVPAGTQSGTRIAVEGKGVPRLRGSGRGQLGVTLLVQTPTRIDDEQRELLRQFAELRDETRPEVTVQKHSRGVFWEAPGRVCRPVRRQRAKRAIRRSEHSERSNQN